MEISDEAIKLINNFGVSCIQDVVTNHNNFIKAEKKLKRYIARLEQKASKTSCKCINKCDKEDNK